MTAPAHALDGWKPIEAEIRRAPCLALFSDFDGTLVRLRRRPGQVALPERVRRTLAAIASSGPVVGIVSGRKIADVRRRVGLRGIWYVGAHGFYLISPGNRLIALASRKERASIRRIERVLARGLRGLPGLHMESKDATLAVHYRAASARTAARARRMIAGLLERHPNLSLLPGKKVWELLPNSHTDKWKAISFILRRLRHGARPGRCLPIFLGDDVTDERVFRKMDGISIAVGKKHRTAARFHLHSPAEVAQFLERVKQAVA
jgi:trehalose-phosphatase